LRRRLLIEALEDRVTPVLVTTPMVSPAALVAFIAPGLATSNIVYTGTPTSAGTFTGGTGIIGFPTGAMLSSGNIANAVGPNVQTGITAVNNTPGDAQLTALAASPTFDATILEFDFVPNFNTL